LEHRQTRIKRRLRRTVRRIYRTASSAFRRALKEGPAFAFAHPIQAASGASVVALVVFFANDIWTQDIFIDDVVIAGGIAGSANYTGSVLTETAIAGMKRVSAERARQAAFSGKRVLQILERKSDKFATERICNSTFQVGKFDDLFLIGAQRGIMSSQTFDQVMTGKSAGLRQAAFAVRQRLGWPARQLQLFLSAKGSRFEVRIEPSPPIVPALTQIIDSLDREEVSRAFSSLLLDVLSPELMAVEVLWHGSPDYSKPKAIARDYLQDRQKELLISSISMGAQLEASRTQADRYFNYEDLKPENEKLLRELDFSRYGELGSILKATIVERITTAEKIDLKSAYSKYVMPIEAELSSSVAGKLMLSQYDVSLGQFDKFRARVNSALLQNASLAKEDRIDETDLTIFFAMSAIDAQAWQEADKLLSQTESKLVADANSEERRKQVILIRTLKAIKDANLGTTTEYEKLAGQGFSGYVCAEYLAIISVFNAVAAKAVDDPTRQRMIALILDGFERISMGGIRGFEFFNLWGYAADEAKDYKVAISKYEEALKYEGDHAWALLNWGKVAFEDGDLITARKKYQESLAIGVVGNAVRGLLVTLYEQKNMSEYNDMFAKYREKLSAFNLEIRSRFELRALKAACKQGKQSVTTILRPDEMLIIEGKQYEPKTFDYGSCELRPAQ
jgi:tetratricopeptide (TPR) repeat protein